MSTCSSSSEEMIKLFDEVTNLWGNMITHELLHLAWWKFTWTRTLATSRSLLIIKVIGQNVFIERGKNGSS